MTMSMASSDCSVGSPIYKFVDLQKQWREVVLCSLVPQSLSLAQIIRDGDESSYEYWYFLMYDRPAGDHHWTCK